LKVKRRFLHHDANRLSAAVASVGCGGGVGGAGGFCSDWRRGRGSCTHPICPWEMRFFVVLSGKSRPSDEPFQVG
jgi:hypothetical protein